MKENIYNPYPLTLTEGYFSDKEYNSYDMMSESIDNWEQLCPYQLLPHIPNGRHQILQLRSIQISYGERNGGTMHYAGTAENTLSIGTVEACVGKVCFGHLKIQTGDILFFDDTYPHNFLTSDAIKFIGITISKEKLEAKVSKFAHALDHLIHDTDGRYAAKLHEILKHFNDTSEKKKDIQRFQEAEKEILETIMGLLAEQTPFIPKLTSGEKIALDIRDQVFHHMDGNISIGSLAKQYKISEQTLQNSFKSLFGFTPQYFLRVLKLNIVHQEFQKSQAAETTVSRVANKWGFKHMGRFSAYYKALFGVNPSQTLKGTQGDKEDIMAACVSRQEEIT